MAPGKDTPQLPAGPDASHGKLVCAVDPPLARRRTGGFPLSAGSRRRRRHPQLGAGGKESFFPHHVVGDVLPSAHQSHVPVALFKKQMALLSLFLSLTSFNSVFGHFLRDGYAINVPLICLSDHHCWLVYCSY